MDLLCRLPREIEIYIYEFNPEHRILFKPCLEDIERNVNRVNNIEYSSRNTIASAVRAIIDELMGEFVEIDTQDP
tara:strand:+ start:1702 stop:1926 length:225 start_codon:yes stop_codon:yes gene_type:complete